MLQICTLSLEAVQNVFSVSGAPSRRNSFPHRSHQLLIDNLLTPSHIKLSCVAVPSDFTHSTDPVQMPELRPLPRSSPRGVRFEGSCALCVLADRVFASFFRPHLDTSATDTIMLPLLSARLAVFTILLASKHVVAPDRIITVANNCDYTIWPGLILVRYTRQAKWE